MNYNRIRNPITGRLVKTTSKLGRNIIHNYINQLGGQDVCGYDEKTKRCNKKSVGNLNEKCELGDTNRCRLKNSLKVAKNFKKIADSRTSIPKIPNKIKHYEPVYRLDNPEYGLEPRFGLMWPDLDPLNLYDIVKVFDSIQKKNPDKYSTFINDSWDLIENLRKQIEDPNSMYRVGGPLDNNDLPSTHFKWDRMEHMNKLTIHLTNKDDLRKLGNNELTKLISSVASLASSSDIMIKCPKPGEDEYYGQEIELVLQPYYGINKKTGKYLLRDSIVDILMEVDGSENGHKTIDSLINKVLSYSQMYTIDGYSRRSIIKLVKMASGLNKNIDIEMEDGTLILFNLYYN